MVTQFHQQLNKSYRMPVSTEVAAMIEIVAANSSKNRNKAVNQRELKVLKVAAGRLIKHRKDIITATR